MGSEMCIRDRAQLFWRRRLTYIHDVAIMSLKRAGPSFEPSDFTSPKAPSFIEIGSVILEKKMNLDWKINNNSEVDKHAMDFRTDKVTINKFELILIFPCLYIFFLTQR